VLFAFVAEFVHLETEGGCVHHGFCLHLMCPMYLLHMHRFVVQLKYDDGNMK